MVTKAEIDTIIRIGTEIQKEILDLMQSATLEYAKIGGSAYGFTFISASGDFQWSFSKTPKADDLCGRWEIWSTKIQSLFTGNSDQKLYSKFCTIDGNIKSGWREHISSPADAIEKYKDLFSNLNRYLENVSRYALPDVDSLNINTEKLNITINAEEVTVILRGMKDILVEVKDLIESGDLKVGNPEYIELLDDAIVTDDRSKLKKAFDRFREDVVVVNPLVQFIATSVSMASSIIGWL